MNLGMPAPAGSPNAGKSLRSGSNGYGWYDDATGAPISNQDYMNQAAQYQGAGWQDAAHQMDQARMGITQQAAGALQGMANSGNLFGQGQVGGDGRGGMGVSFGGPPQPPSMGGGPNRGGMSGGMGLASFPGADMSGVGKAAGYQPSPLQAPAPLRGLQAPSPAQMPGQLGAAQAAPAFNPGGYGSMRPVQGAAPLPAFQGPPPPPSMNTPGQAGTTVGVAPNTRPHHAPPAMRGGGNSMFTALGQGKRRYLAMRPQNDMNQYQR